MIRNMTTGSVPKQIISFALPMLFAELLQELHYTADSFVAGNFFSRDNDLVIAAIGSTWHILMLLLSFLLGFSIGGSVIIAQFVGANKGKRLGETSTTLIINVLMVAPIVGIIPGIFADDILRLLQVPAAVLPHATTYLRVMLVGMVFLVGYAQVSAIFRGLGDSKTPLILVLLSLIINLVISLLLVVFFDIGILGLALSTLAAQGIMFFIGIWILVFRYRLLPTNILDWTFSRYIWTRIMKVAYPIGLEMMLGAGSILAISWFINGSGAHVVAAVSIAQNFDEMVSVAGLSIAGAVSIFVGQNIGAGRIDRVKQAARAGAALAALVALLATVMAFISSRQVGLLFTSDVNILTAMSEYLSIVSMFYIIYAVTLVVGGVLQGAGQTVVPMVASLISLWVVRVPLTWKLSYQSGPEGIWWAQVIAWIICFVLVVGFYFFWRPWRKNPLLTEDHCPLRVLINAVKGLFLKHFRKSITL